MTVVQPFGRPACGGGVVWARRFRSVLATGAVAIASPRRIRATGPRLRTPGILFILISGIAAAVVTGGLMLFVDSHTLGLRDKLSDHAWVAMLIITNLGQSGWILFPAAAAVIGLVAAAASPRLTGAGQYVLAALATRFGFVFLAIAVPGLAVAIVKRLIGRARPYVLHASPFDYAPFVWRKEFASMPSGHVTTACAAAIAIGALFPRLRPLLWTFAGLVAMSRVALDDHYPSDVFVGFLAGTAGAILVRNWFARRRIVFVIGPDGSARVARGPSLRRVVAALTEAVSLRHRPSPR
jgi:undecaprenyl-diphosphatase